MPAGSTLECDLDAERMMSSNGFRLPFSPPTAVEAAALAHAAAYLKRAANELDTRRLARFGGHTAEEIGTDLSAQLTSAGSLCETMRELA